MAPKLSGSTPCVMVVTLGKGGVGKTTTTANLAASLARLGLPVVAVDAGLGEELKLAVVQGRQAVRASPPSPAVPRKHAPLSLGGFSGLAWEQRKKGKAPGGEAGGARALAVTIPTHKMPCGRGRRGMHHRQGRLHRPGHRGPLRSPHQDLPRGRPLPGTDRRVVFVCGLFCIIIDAADLVLKKLFYLGNQVIDTKPTVVPDACCGALIG